MAGINEQRLKKLDEEGKLNNMHLFTVRNLINETDHLVPGGAVARCLNSDYEVRYHGPNRLAAPTGGEPSPKQEAEKILEEAKAEAVRIVADAKAEASKLTAKPGKKTEVTPPTSTDAGTDTGAQS
jgi:cell division septum initiation protein DivIVA